MDLSSHYKNISSDYDIHYAPHYTAVTSIILDNVSFSPEDVVVDLGGGTGEMAHLLFQKVGLQKPVLCVDPSPDMLEVAKAKEGVITFNGTACEFLGTETQGKFDKVCTLASAHHFKDIRFIFSKILERLSFNGLCVYGNYSDEVSLPFFKQAKQLESANLGTYKFEDILDVFQSVGMKTRVFHGIRVQNVAKELWYSALRKRMYSVLERLSDEEIEAGIEELEQSYMDTDSIDLEFKWDFIVGNK